MAEKLTPPRELNERISADPDLVDRIFDYILADPALSEAIRAHAQADKTTLAKLKTAVRQEFKGEECYIQGRPGQATAQKVLALFNGRNATEVARSLGISRASVYRHLKQAGRAPR